MMPDIYKDSAVHRLVCVVGHAVLLALVIAFPGAAQAPQLSTGMDQMRNGNGGGGRQIFIPDTGSSQSAPGLTLRQLRALNAERQKGLVSDTDKLLRLAGELNDAFSKSDSMTRDDLHKVSEIEKLARSVKGKMSTSVQTSFGGSGPF